MSRSRGDHVSLPRRVPGTIDGRNLKGYYSELGLLILGKQAKEFAGLLVM
jgi:hypothetical protein